MIKRIKDIATVQFGYHTPSDVNADIPYLQAKHFDELGQYQNHLDTFIADTPKVRENFLEKDDILFTSKGFRVFAALVTDELINTVASSLFYIIKVDSKLVLPQYLVAILNTQKNIQYFKQLGAGSSIPSIRKNEIMDFSFNLIPIAQQQKIVELNQLFIKDIALTQNLMQQKHIFYNDTITKLVNLHNE
jgi:restriction endonuclease S subunit